MEFGFSQVLNKHVDKSATLLQILLRYSFDNLPLFSRHGWLLLAVQLRREKGEGRREKGDRKTKVLNQPCRAR